MQCAQGCLQQQAQLETLDTCTVLYCTVLYCTVIRDGGLLRKVRLAINYWTQATGNSHMFFTHTCHHTRPN